MSESRRRGGRAARRSRFQMLFVERLEPRRLLSGSLENIGMQPVGALTGKIVYTSAGHGWNWSDVLSRWATDRGDNNEIVEDFGNQDQMTFYVDYLLRAGATVVPMRPVGRQLNEVVLDNDSPAVTWSGSWTDNTAGPRWYDEDYGAALDPVKYRFANVNSTSETATATYTPNIPEAGLYPVYTWVAHGDNRTTQLYKINHNGGQFQMRVDHSMVGNGWVYLGTYHFNAGSSVANGSVQISNFSTGGGSVVIADAIRFGNGMGDVPNGPNGIGNTSGTLSGHPREDENSLHWLWRGVGQGVTPSSVLGTSNVSAPSRMAEHMHANTNPFGSAVYIGFHSNAGGGRGAVGLINSTVSQRTPNQSQLALYTGRQINQDMQALDGTYEHNWSTRTTHTFSGSFGEINAARFTNSSSVVEMDATIIEVAFHDSVEDAQLMRDPKVRDQLARSTYDATLEYFINHASLSNTTALPSAPHTVRAVSNGSGQVTVSWVAGPSSPVSVFGHAPSGYRIFISTDGYGFDGGVVVPGGATNNFTISGLDPNIPHYLKVAAENAGGQSLASEVITALPSGGVRQVLIVNGFDRFDRFQNFRYPYAFTGDGLTDRVWPRYNNSFDYAVQVHNAIHASKPGTHVASTSNEAVINGSVDLNDYQTVIWILGTESTADRTFDPTEQAKVEQFIAQGGNLFVTGAEIAWDLDQQNNGRTFFRNTLLGLYVADSANTYNASAAGSGIFSGLSNFSFSSGSQFSSLDGQMFNVRFPDVISPQPGAQTALSYSGGTGGGAAIQAQGTGGRGSVVVFGFPFETITNLNTRTSAMGRVLDFFNAVPPLPAPGAPELLAASDSGVSDTDGITNFNNSTPLRALEFVVTGTVPGAVVTILANDAEIGSAVAAGATTLVTTDGVTTLSDGSYQITATQTPVGGQPSDASTPLSIQIDTTPPTVLGSNFAFATSHQLAFAFNENVGPTIALNDLLLANLTSSQTIDSATMDLTYNGAADLAIVTFPGQPGQILPDGNYRATLASSGITDAAGNPLSSDHELDFFFLLGDANRDRMVNLDDFNILAANFGQSPRDFTQGDFSYDGVVNLEDFNILASRFGAMLADAGLSSQSKRFGSKPIDDPVDDDDAISELLA